MLDKLEILPPDPILGIGQLFNEEKDPNKVGLSVGVYQTENSHTPVLAAVKKAESEMLSNQDSKVYIPQAGDPAFLAGMNKLIFGEELLAANQDRIASIMVPGGCGGLRVGAEVINASRPGADIWLSTPTWGNHFPLLQSAGLTMQSYAYYDSVKGVVDFEAMLDAFQQIPEQGIALLHACCHNPTGADLSDQQWHQLFDVIVERKLIPFIDAAYLGFSGSLDEDCLPIRIAAKRVPEAIVVTSCSKNFGLYRERTGMLTFIGDNALAAQSVGMSKARQSYSMSPFHGGGIVGTILSDAALTTEWVDEVYFMRDRMNELRAEFAQQMNNKQSIRDFSFIASNRGMFSNLGINKEHVIRLREEFKIYMLESSRINIAGLARSKMDYTTDCIARVLTT